MRRFWSDPLATRRSRLFSFFLLYVSEGLPSGFATVAVATQMRRGNLDPAAIGTFVGALYLPWAFKWAVGPIVDTITSAKFGRRRTWIVGAQVAMMVTLLAALPVDPVAQLGLFTALLLVHNACAATQDVAIDALAVQVLPPEERGAANGFMFAGQSVGIALGGSGVLMLTSAMPFRATYLLVVAALGVILVLVSWRVREGYDPIAAAMETAGESAARIKAALAAFVREAARAFTSTRSAGLGVLLAILPMGAYALGLALQSNLAVELGLTDAKIGVLGLWSGLAGAVGCIVGGWMSDRFGRRRMIAVFIALMSVPNVWLALAMQHAGHIAATDPTLAAQTVQPAGLVATFLGACIAYNFAQGLMYGSSTALYMDITTPAVAATQFTAYMALSNLATSYSATWQGHSIQRFGYPLTLGIDATLGLVSMVLLPWIRPVATAPPAADALPPGAAIPEGVPH